MVNVQLFLWDEYFPNISKHGILGFQKKMRNQNRKSIKKNEKI